MTTARLVSLWTATVWLLLPHVSSGRLDHGGWMSRDLAVGDTGVVETVYATTVSDADDLAATPLCATTGNSCDDPSDDDDDHPWCCNHSLWETLGNCTDEPMTLWAFCADKDCTGVSDDDLDCKPSTHPEYDPAITPRLCELCDKPCKWRRPLCGSKGTPSTGSDPGGINGSSYAPPVVSQDGAHIFAASVDGNVYAFSDEGDLLWKWDAEYEDELDAQFYARPALDEWDGGFECTRRSLYLASVDSRLFSFDASDESCGVMDPVPGTLRDGYPFAPRVGLGGDPAVGDFLFEPIVDTRHTDPVGSMTRVDNADGCPRVYIASEKNTEGIWAIDTCSDGDDDPTTNPDDPATGDPDQDGPDTVWRCFWKKSGGGNNKALQTLSFKLGGTIYEESGKRRLLIANAQTGTVAINLDEPPRDDADPAKAQACGGPDTGTNRVVDPPNSEYWIHAGGKSAVGNQDERTHRSYPTLSQPQDEGHPALYLTGKGGAIVHLSVLGPTTKTVNGYEQEVPGLLSQGGTNYLFPNPGGIPDLSFSSATANPHQGSLTAGFLFVGPAKDEGVYRIDPDAVPDDSPAWFDYTPEDGWRTTPVFTNGGARVHIGSAKSIIYALDPNACCGQAEWCWDARKASEIADPPNVTAGGDCTGSTPTAPCCQAANLATACSAATGMP